MSPAQIALDFARECLGWERPTDRKYAERNTDPLGKPSMVWTPYIFDYFGKNGQLHYTDLNEVMTEVRVWCVRKGMSFILTWDSSGFEAAVFFRMALEK